MRFEPLEPRLTLAAAGLVSVGTQPAGNLSGKIVFATPGHGYNWSAGAWRTDRGNNNEIVEDFGNQDQFTLYVDYLFRSGATVVPMRPVGRQTNERVLDNQLAVSPNAAIGTVTFSDHNPDPLLDDWTTSATATRWYDADYGATADSVRYRFTSTSASETATVTYTPNMPAAGFYPVYTWAAAGGNRTAQLYKVNHTGGQTKVTVDHSKVGTGWVYLGTYHFDAGTTTVGGDAQGVVISNEGSPGSVVIADAIRFGNGVGDLAWGTGGPGTGSTSGKPREEEHSFMWVWRGYGQWTDPTNDPANVLLDSDNDGLVDDDEFQAPAIMAGRMNLSAYGNAVYVGIHSNAAASPSGRGSEGLYSASNPTPNQQSLATYMGRQVETDLVALGYDWGARGDALGGAFGEINNAWYNGEMDSTIVEVGFHTNTGDSAAMKSPVGRDQMARSIYEATLEYFDNFGANPQPTNITLPSAPTNVRIVSSASGQVTLNWVAGPSSANGYNGANGSPATLGFRIYASSDGYGFDGGTAVVGVGTTSATLTGLDPTKAYYFKVVAVNVGGESKATEVVTALPSGGVKQVLIVNGYDRNDEALNFQYATPLVLPSSTNVVTDRVWQRYNNSFDYVVQAMTAIQGSKPGVHVASSSNEAVISGAVNLNDYDAVVWILGTESTVDDTLNATEQSLVANFINAGGDLFISGSEIAWDLDSQGNGVSFFENTLKGNFVADDANTYTANANAGGIFNGMGSIGFSNGTTFNSLDGQVYNVSTPDIIAAQSGAVAALTYAGGSGVRTAAIQVDGLGGAGDVVMFGFPFEAMTNASQRQVAMGRILDFFGVSTEIAAVDIKTRVNGQEADSPTGPVLDAGSTANFTYVITNTRNVALSSIVVADNNGTPGNAADDFNPTFTGGDTNGNSQLDVGETWNYSADRTVVAGQYTTTGTVTSVFNSQNYMDTDAANYFGAAPAINIESHIGGDDADTPTGPIVDFGSTVIFNYQLTNTGNVPLSGIVLIDDNGTPGNAADDFTPTFSGGDTNGNSQVDAGETWSYFRSRTSVAGQYAGTATVTAVGNAQPVMDSDLTHYFGPFAAVSIQSFIEGDDADSPPGPTLIVGGTAVFTYVVSNDGNVPLDAINVTDNNGTPGNSADDFSPTLMSGDTNSNNVLDEGETWTFSAVRTVIAGQQIHEAIVTDDNAGLGEQDIVSYLGVVAENADFNRDGVVDAADVIVWVKTNGMTVAAGTLGDANNDTQVDNADYLIWQKQFGTSPGAGGGSLAAAASQDDETSGVSQQLFVQDTMAASSNSPTNPAATDVVFGALIESRDVPRNRNRTGLVRTPAMDLVTRSDHQLLSVFLAERCASHEDVEASMAATAASDRAIERLGSTAGVDGARIEIGPRLKSPFAAQKLL